MPGQHAPCNVDGLTTKESAPGVSSESKSLGDPHRGDVEVQECPESSEVVITADAGAAPETAAAGTPSLEDSVANPVDISGDVHDGAVVLSASPANTVDTQEAAQCENACVTQQDLHGDYQWASIDGLTQGILRLKPGGQWWHAVHRSAKERGRVIEPGSQAARRRAEKPGLDTKIKSALKGDFSAPGQQSTLEDLTGRYEEVDVWEISESLGSWSLCDLQEGSAPMVLLTLEHWSWKSSHPTAPSVLQPTEDCKIELENMAAMGQLTLCYAIGRCHEKAVSKLDLQMPFTASSESGAGSQRRARMRSVQAACQTLGFAKSYLGGSEAENLRAASTTGAVAPIVAAETDG